MIVIRLIVLFHDEDSLQECEQTHLCNDQILLFFHCSFLSLMLGQETLNRPDCFHFPLMMTQKAFQAKFDKCDSTVANHI